jgi:glycosyltransferase involved in cell wall biosynthesis
MLAEVSAAAVIGGAERVLREEALGLQQRGHRVRVVARAPAGDCLTKVTIGSVVESRYTVSRRNEAAFVLSSVIRSISALDEARAEGRWDVAVVHQSVGGLGPILWRAKAVGGWVYVCHSLAHEEYRSRTSPGPSALERARHALNMRVRQWSERVVMRRCRRIVVLSEFMRRRVMQVHHVPESRLRIVPGAADPVRFHPAPDPSDVRRRLKLPLSKVVLFTVRNLVPRMGLENLVQALAGLGEEGRDLQVLIGGDGVLRSPLEHRIRDLHLNDRVRLLGFVAEEELPLYYQAADLVLMPTEELEGFGLVTVEAMACGTPVLGTPVGAIPEVLARVDPALIADGTDGVALASALRRVLRRFRDQPGEEQRLSAKCRALVEDEYNWRRHTERLELVLRGVAG